MQKSIKILVLTLILLCVGNNVYADNICYNMIGPNNQMVIPSGYYGYCGTYTLDTSLSDKPEDESYPNDSDPIELIYSRNPNNGATSASLKYSNISGSYFAEFTFRENKYEQDYIQQDIQTSSWDGLNFDSNKPNFDNVKIDENISGCPKIIYWSDDNTNRRTIGFCANESCSRSGERIYVYKLSNNTSLLYTQDIYASANSLKTASDINNDIRSCTEVEQNESTGEDSYIDNTTTSVTTTTLKTCKYYFGLDNYAGEDCSVAEVELSYNKKTQAGTSTYTVTSSFSGLDLGFIQDKLNTVTDNSTYSNISDYLIYNEDGSWTCAEKLYIIRDTGGDMPVLGAIDYSNSPYYGLTNVVEESNSSQSNLCPVNSDSDYEPIDWGDKADVNCNGIIGPELLSFIKKIFRWIQIIAPIFVIIMGAVEFAGAVLQDDKDALKKATSKFTKRLIVAVALFFIPIILSFVLDIFNEVTGAATDICI